MTSALPSTAPTMMVPKIITSTHKMVMSIHLPLASSWIRSCTDVDEKFVSFDVYGANSVAVTISSTIWNPLVFVSVFKSGDTCVALHSAPGYASQNDNRPCTSRLFPLWCRSLQILLFKIWWLKFKITDVSRSSIHVDVVWNGQSVSSDCCCKTKRKNRNINK